MEQLKVKELLENQNNPVVVIKQLKPMMWMEELMEMPNMIVKKQKLKNKLLK